MIMRPLLPRMEGVTGSHCFCVACNMCVCVCVFVCLFVWLFVCFFFCVCVFFVCVCLFVFARLSWLAWLACLAGLLAGLLACLFACLLACLLACLVFFVFLHMSFTLLHISNTPAHSGMLLWTLGLFEHDAYFWTICYR